jgi:hypothetical protein
MCSATKENIICDLRDILDMIEVKCKHRPVVFPERCMIQFWNNKSSIQKIGSHNSINYLHPQTICIFSMPEILHPLHQI